MRLIVARVDYVLINEAKKDRHTGQPSRTSGMRVCAGIGREGVVASLMEELRPEEYGNIIEITRVDNIREAVIFHPQEFSIPARELRAAAAAVASSNAGLSEESAT